MPALSLIGSSIGLLLLLGLLALIAGHCQRATVFVYAASAAAAAIIAYLALSYLIMGSIGNEIVSYPIGLPWLRVQLGIDSLSAFFLFVVNLGAVAASVFGIGYDKNDGHGSHGTGRFLPLFPLFLAGMNIVLVASDAFTFLLGWEFMSLSSWLLVLSTHREEGTSRAANIYLVMAGFGTAALLLAFGLLAAGNGDITFAAMRAVPLSPLMASVVFGLVLIGAGSKAGLVPLHVWLPLAHPAAPSHVSALMSGVMTKVAIYGLIRIVFDLVGQPLWWWGMIVLVLGGITAVLGVLQAMMQRDLKSMLAYSTVENIGIITIGLGLTLAFQANGMKALAALAMTAALFHVLNHAIFKSLLFLGVGCVLTATHQRDMEKMGGLIHKMPITAAAFLVGCIAISGLPPMNGFVSEWLTFQAILNGSDLVQWPVRVAVPVVGALLALAVALAAGAFVRTYGVVFLGRARSSHASDAVEVSFSMKASVAVLALLCLVIGVLPTSVLSLISPLISQFVGVPLQVGSGLSWLTLTSETDGGGSYNGVVLLVMVLAFMAGLIYTMHSFGNRTSRRSIPWGCGFTDDPGPVSQYTASSFAQPIRRVFGASLFSARDHVDMPKPGETRAAVFRVTMRDPVWDWVFTPLLGSIGALTDKINILQSLTIRHYLGLMLATLVVLIGVVAAIQ
ncbi:MAG: hydrogenase 4 subunit B [Azospirillum sp.]|nr:hydrogenase 4 subunit B [Azospirillum sp.]